MKSQPITYETDPEVLKKEKRRKIMENREKMQMKRQKPLNKQEDEFKEVTMTTKKIKEKEITGTPNFPLSEDSTQPSNSDESVKTARPPPQNNVREVVPREPGEKTKFVKTYDRTSKLASLSEEEIGDIQLVDEDPYAVAKKHIIKKRAQELARKKQVEEAARKRLERENCSYNNTSPDDTLKNVSSIQFESQMSIIQRKRRQSKSRDQSSDEALVEPKSNELYIQDVPERVMN